MRIVPIALAAFAVAGCGGETVLRIDIPDPGASPPPTSLRVTLVGVNAAPRTIAPITFPGTVVVHNVPASVSQLCVQVDGLDDAGNELVGGAAIALLSTHHTAHATVSLSRSPTSCAELAPSDLGDGPVDMAGGASSDHDLAPIQICPATAIFCDDFESGNVGQWSTTDIKQDAGAVDVQSATTAHGAYALRALANGAPGSDELAEVTKRFTPTTPPFALRANVYFPQTLQHYDHVIALYENSSSTSSFSIGGDNSAFWVVAENESMAGDFVSDMVPTGAGQWHCVELVIDGAG
ncbi:MAG: hypothetical protein LC659_07960, partial [Myxococcales bacterium]|nr:hypothetical protein [Myxococcales bacterium]